MSLCCIVSPYLWPQWHLEVCVLRTEARTYTVLFFFSLVCRFYYEDPAGPIRAGVCEERRGTKCFVLGVCPVSRRIAWRRIIRPIPSHLHPPSASGGPLASTPRVSKVLVGALSTSGVPAAPKRDGGEGKGREGPLVLGFGSSEPTYAAGLVLYVAVLGCAEGEDS